MALIIRSLSSNRLKIRPLISIYNRISTNLCKYCTDLRIDKYNNAQKQKLLSFKYFCTGNTNSFNAVIDAVTFERNCAETLEALCDYFEELVEHSQHLKAADISFGDGVLTVNFGPPYGTYVINRQSPNRQIWLSSPVSGPKRFEFVANKQTIGDGYWLYRHDGNSLHDLLQAEIAGIVETNVNFLDLPFGRQK